MIAVAFQDIAIARALENGTLKFKECPTRQALVDMGFDPTYVAISDDHGLIEVQDTMAAAEARVEEVKRRLVRR